jgi:hypothetical protein
MTAMKCIIVSLLACLLGATACSARKDPMAASLAERNLDYRMPMNTAVFLDDALQRIISVENTSTGRNGANGLTVVATLRNRTDGQMKLSARTRFLGADQHVVESTAWSHLTLDRRGIGSYETSATNPAAAYYYIELAYGR